jgi:hypothetical protein
MNSEIGWFCGISFHFTEGRLILVENVRKLEKFEANQSHMTISILQIYKVRHQSCFFSFLIIEFYVAYLFNAFVYRN